MEELLLQINPFWIWLGLAFVLLAVEVLLAPTGFFLCMGTAAAVVALVTLLVPALSWLWALTLFAVLTVVAGWVWWKLVRKRGKAGEDDSLNVKTKQLLGYRGVLSEDIRAGRGRIRINDSHWPVEADEDYPAGTRVEVVAVKGITLKVTAV